MTWAQGVDPYEGPFRAQFGQVVEILLEAHPQYETSERSTRRYRWLSRTLGVLATVLAAAATVTVLPDSINRYVGASLAFLAAVASGLAQTLKPEREATRAARTALRWLRLRDAVYAYTRWIRTLPGTQVDEDEAERRLSDLLAQRDAIIAQAITDDDHPGPAPHV